MSIAKPAKSSMSRAGEVAELVTRTRAFIHEVVLAFEDRHDGDITHARGDELRRSLQATARDCGLLAPHAHTVYGGRALSMTERARVFEAAGYSLFGGLAINAAAGRGQHASARARGHARAAGADLGPLARAEMRSAFAMTEPTPGAGSDPSALQTRATRVAGGWRIDGHKLFITRRRRSGRLHHHGPHLGRARLTGRRDDVPGTGV